MWSIVVMGRDGFTVREGGFPSFACAALALSDVMGGDEWSMGWVVCVRPVAALGVC